MFLRSISIYLEILLLLILVSSSVWLSCSPALADEDANMNLNQKFTGAPSGAVSTPSAEEVEVDRIRERYWAQGKDAEVSVVQNRIYSKRNKFELGISAGSLNGDPFLSSYTLGASLGFHFSEYFSIHGFGWKAFVSPSSALNTLQGDLNTTANTNEPRSFFGGEIRGSLLYGKLSLSGLAILYFDAYLCGGAGSMSTESGNNLAGFIGIGQQIHLSQLFSLNLDYRFLRYNETILGKTPANKGQNLGERTNMGGVVTGSISIFLNLF